MIPVRCFTCNKILGHYFHIEREKLDQKIFDHYNIERFCCKKVLLESVDVHEDIQEPLQSEIFEIKKELERKRLVIPF